MHIIIIIFRRTCTPVENTKNQFRLSKNIEQGTLLYFYMYFGMLFLPVYLIRIFPCIVSLPVGPFLANTLPSPRPLPTCKLLHFYSRVLDPLEGAHVHVDPLS